MGLKGGGEKVWYILPQFSAKPNVVEHNIKALNIDKRAKEMGRLFLQLLFLKSHYVHVT